MIKPIRHRKTQVPHKPVSHVKTHQIKNLNVRFFLIYIILVIYVDLIKKIRKNITTKECFIINVSAEFRNVTMTFIVGSIPVPSKCQNSYTILRQKYIHFYLYNFISFFYSSFNVLQYPFIIILQYFKITLNYYPTRNNYQDNEYLRFTSSIYTKQVDKK